MGAGTHATQLELNALTLDEILSHRYVPLTTTPDLDRLAERRLTRWRAICADGDAEVFRKRLARDALTIQDVRARLGSIDRRADVPEPLWVGDCRKTLQVLRQAAPADPPGTCDQPFGTMLAPLVAAAIEQVTARSALADPRLLSLSAQADLVAQLWRRLVELCALPLYRSFTNWRHADPTVAECNAHLGHDSFAGYLRTQGFDALFTEYPMLLRLMALTVSQWVESCGEFVDRLAIDRPQLKDIEPAIDATSVVTGVDGELSDPHEGGRTVLLATFAGGARVLYKPKDLATDREMESLLRILHEHGLRQRLRVPRALTRTGYGWTSFVRPEDCQDSSEVDEYFRCAGAWLALFHLLCATDMHMENLIASGCDPVPVDFETILQGLPLRAEFAGAQTAASTEATWLAMSYLDRSVLSVGLLPAHFKTDDRTTLSVGGLEPSIIETKRVEWRDIHTLSIHPEIVTQASRTESNLPTLRGKVARIGEHREALLDGFRTTLEFAQSVSSELALWVNQVGSAALQVRRILRPTRFYYLLRRRLLDFRSMSDSVSWSMQTEVMARYCDWDRDTEEHWSFFACERNALTQLTIPVFRLAANGTALAGSAGAMRFHITSGACSAVGRITALTHAYIAGQTRIVDASLRLESGRSPRLDQGQRSIARLAGDGKCGVDLAAEIYHHLDALAFRGAESAAWLAVDLYGDEQPAHIAPMGLDLYSGTCGIALFLAAFAKTRESADAAILARACVAHLLDTLESTNKKRRLRSLGAGGAVGIGSLIYGLATLAQLLGDERILNAAAVAAATLTGETIGEDSYFDVIGGVAGSCLALLKLFRLTNDKTILAQAVRCGDHLLAHRPQGHGIWSNAAFGHSALTGVSHGASGFALTFSRLFAVTGNERYRGVAQSCVAFENSYYDERRRNWPDLRSDPVTGKRWWPVQWCFGACGIGHARIAMSADGSLDSKWVEADLRASIEATLLAQPYSNDTLCCGVSGHADFLREAGCYLQDPALRKEASARIAEIGMRWRDLGDVHWDSGTRDYNLGLFRGVAGIGYTALRVESPNLPSILTFS